MPSRITRAGRALAAACAAVALLPAAASAAANGPIVFESSSTIVSMPSGGGAKTPLSPAGSHYNPAVSPDGTRIAFAFNGDIWTMRRDGTDRRRVTTDRAGNDDPTWSPDGAKIAYTSFAVGGRSEIFASPATGGPGVNLTRTPANGEANPAWSPAGNRIAYERTGCAVAFGGGVCVYAMNADGSGQFNLTTENFVPGCETQPGYYFNGASREPAWSPNGQLIAFAGPLTCGYGTSGSDIWVMGPTGAGKTNLTKDNGTLDRMPVFSPDGTRLALVRPGIGVFTMAATPGGGRLQISSGAFDLHPDWAAA